MGARLDGPAGHTSECRQGAAGRAWVHLGGQRHLVVLAYAHRVIKFQLGGTATPWTTARRGHGRVWDERLPRHGMPWGLSGPLRASRPATSDACESRYWRCMPAWKCSYSASIVFNILRPVPPLQARPNLSTRTATGGGGPVDRDSLPLLPLPSLLPPPSPNSPAPPL